MLGEIIEQASDQSISLPTILRRCLILASRLRHDELRTWAIKELQGYPLGEHENLPEYRVFTVNAKGLFLGPAGIQLKDQPLPSGVMKEADRWWARKSYAMQGVASYEALVAGGSDHITAPWPADLVARYQAGFLSGYTLNRAWQEIPMGALVELLDTVRTRVLLFALELESDQIDIEAAISSGTQAEIAPAVTQIFNTTIHGGSAIIGSHAGHSINSAEKLLVVEGDFVGLKDRLAIEGVSNDEVATLKALLATEEASAKAGKTLTASMKGWISAAATSIVKKGGEATLDVAKTALTGALTSYLGLPNT